MGTTTPEPTGHPAAGALHLHRACTVLILGMIATALLAAYTGPPVLAAGMWVVTPWAVGEVVTWHCGEGDGKARMLALTASLLMGLGALTGSITALFAGWGGGAAEGVCVVVGSVLAVVAPVVWGLIHSPAV